MCSQTKARKVCVGPQRLSWSPRIVLRRGFNDACTQLPADHGFCAVCALCIAVAILGGIPACMQGPACPTDALLRACRLPKSYLVVPSGCTMSSMPWMSVPCHGLYSTLHMAHRGVGIWVLGDSFECLACCLCWRLVHSCEACCAAFEVLTWELGYINQNALLNSVVSLLFLFRLL